MSTRIEWADTSAFFSYSAEPGFFEDQYGTTNDGPAIGVFTGSDGFVLEAGSAGDLRRCLVRLIRAIDNAGRCGGCRGLGAHYRWCEKLVGPTARRYGELSAEVDSLGDSAGIPEVQNLLWSAAGQLRARADEVAEVWRSAHPEAPRRDGRPA